MLEKTFVHIQGIGYQTERRLWMHGAENWNAFLANPESFRIPRIPYDMVLEIISRSPAALDSGDFRFFQERLSPRDHWRALHSFPGRVQYLDIETDGGTEFDCVTVIGLYDGATLRQFVRGENLLEFDEALEDTALLVTFFGGGFDIPVLRRAFPRMKFDQLHLDLCPALRRLGLRGGLKAIERHLGMERSAETSGLGGWDAVRLWREWRYGSAEARELLLSYNAEDVVNMVPLARLAYNQLAERTISHE